MKRILSLGSMSLLLCACAAKTEIPGAVSINSLEWQSEQTGTDDSGAPQTTVSLVNTDTDETIVSVECVGTVSPLESMEHTVRCWYAGGGNDYALFEEDGVWLPHTRWVDEESGEGSWEEML